MRYLLKSFFKGLIIIFPIGASFYIVYWLVTFVDGLVPLPKKIPGLGIGIAILFVTIVGILASNVFGQWLVRIIESGIERLPVVKLLYSSIKDLLGAFVGDRKSFQHPVMVDLTPDGTIRALGFVTCRHFDDPKLAHHVAVYLPQSYNFAGNLVVVPESRVKRIDADGAQFMAFIVSGGVAEMHAASTVSDGRSPLASTH